MIDILWCSVITYLREVTTLKLSEEDIEYLTILKRARNAIVSGAQSYSIGSRSVTRADLQFITGEIARLEGSTAPIIRRVIARDK